MRIAALYDIHGNLPALEAVAHELEDEAPDLVIVGGDVLPGPMPSECVDLLNALRPPKRYILGNGEVDVLAFRAGRTPARVPEAFHPSMRWNAERLTETMAETIATWSLTESIQVDGLGRIVFCHAAPDDENAIFTRLTPEERLSPRLSPARADVIVCGHTHMAFDRMVGDTRVVNAGSVGMPFGEPGAHWLMIDEKGPSLRRTSYALRAAEQAIFATGYPDAELMRLVEPPPEAQMVEAFEAVALR